MPSSRSADSVNAAAVGAGRAAQGLAVHRDCCPHRAGRRVFVLVGGAGGVRTAGEPAAGATRVGKPGQPVPQVGQVIAAGRIGTGELAQPAGMELMTQQARSSVVVISELDCP